MSITTDILADEVYDEQLRRITTFVEARHDMDKFALPSLDGDVSVATPISDQAQVDYTNTRDSLVGEAAFSVRF